MEYLTEDEYAEHIHRPKTRQPHEICAMLRDLRRAAGLSLAEMQTQHGIPAVVLGAYERGDREPPLKKLDFILNVFGYKLVAVPASDEAVRLPEDLVALLRLIANQFERQSHGVPELHDTEPQ